jgi:hypothetical protein
MNSLVALGMTTGTALADPAQLAAFVFDISDSAPVAVDRRVAAAAGRTIEEIVLGMNPEDRVKLRSLGLAGIADQQIAIDVTLGRKAASRPDRIAPALSDLVASFPDLVMAGDLQIQNQTNIIGFVEALAPGLDCQSVSTRIVIFSDGIEWSSQVLGSELLSGEADLPPPSGPVLSGCTVEMRGLGQQTSALGTNSRWFPILRDQWTAIFEAAGVAQFTAYATFN